jgi:hypothetical protein
VELARSSIVVSGALSLVAAASCWPSAWSCSSFAASDSSRRGPRSAAGRAAGRGRPSRPASGIELGGASGEGLGVLLGELLGEGVLLGLPLDIELGGASGEGLGVLLGELLGEGVLLGLPLDIELGGAGGEGLGVLLAEGVALGLEHADSGGEQVGVEEAEREEEVRVEGHLAEVAAALGEGGGVLGGLGEGEAAHEHELESRLVVGGGQPLGHDGQLAAVIGAGGADDLWEAGGGEDAQLGVVLRERLAVGIDDQGGDGQRHTACSSLRVTVRPARSRSRWRRRPR